MLICVVILFLLCWGPRFIFELLMKMQFSWLYYEHVYVIRIILFLLPMVHAILNPVVYFIMNRNFRNSVVKKCAKGCRKNLNQGSFEDLEMKSRVSHNGLRANFSNGITSKRQSSNGNTGVTRTTSLAVPSGGINQHELVVVRENGQVTVDLIDQCQKSKET